jgi:hypothetical protein
LQHLKKHSERESTASYQDLKEAQKISDNGRIKPAVDLDLDDPMMVVKAEMEC